MQHVDVIAPLLDEWRQSLEEDLPHKERIKEEKNALLAEFLEHARRMSPIGFMVYQHTQTAVYFATLWLPLGMRCYAASYPTRTFCSRRLESGNADEMRAYANVLLLNLVDEHTKQTSFPANATVVFFRDLACVRYAMERLNPDHVATRMVVAYEEELTGYARNLAYQIVVPHVRLLFWALVIAAVGGVLRCYLTSRALIVT